MRSLTCLAIVALSLVSCAPVLSRERHIERTERIATTSLPQVHYIGSTEHYDWFEYGLGARYKVRKGEITIDPRMPRTDDRAKWQMVGLNGRVMPSIHVARPGQPPSRVVRPPSPVD